MDNQAIRKSGQILLMGLDLGTSGVKVVIIGTMGEIITSAYKDYDIVILKEGYAEQNPDIWWAKTCECIKAAVNAIPTQDYTIKSIGLSGQMHSLVLLDKRKEPIRPAILWCDQRSEAQVKEIYSILSDDDFSNKLLNPVAVGFTGALLLWVKQHEYELYERAEHVLLSKDYIRYKLTGEIGTEVSDAAATLLFDIKGKQWAFDIMNKLGIDRKKFPAVFNSCNIAGHTTRTAYKDCGLPPGIPVVYGGGGPTYASGGQRYYPKRDIIVHNRYRRATTYGARSADFRFAV